MRTTRWIVVAMLALATAVVVPATGTASEESPGSCAGVFPEPYVRPEECICWPCADEGEPEGTDP